MTAPRWRKQFASREEAARKEPWGLNDFDFVEELEQKYLAGFWTSNAIAAHPARDQDGYDWTGDYADKIAVREIPSLMFQKLEGGVRRRNTQHRDAQR